MRNVKRHTPCSPRKAGKAVRIFPVCPVTVKTPWSEGGPQFLPKGWLGRGERKVCYVCHSRQKRDARDSRGPRARPRCGPAGRPARSCVRLAHGWSENGVAFVWDDVRLGEKPPAAHIATDTPLSGRGC